MAELVGFKVWIYENGELYTLTSENTKWQDVPIENIQWLKKYWYHPERTQNQYLTEDVSGQDVYVLTNEMLDSLKPSLSNKMKFGKYLPSSEFGKIFKTCKADNEIVKKMI